MKRRLVSFDEAATVATQHTGPCSDCPFSVYSINGWLGKSTPEDFIQLAHSDSLYSCHALVRPGRKELQCAGLAVFRANICKVPRDQSVLRLPQDKKMVFPTATAFLEHHRARWIDEEDED